ncbi:MAG: ATP-binding cassette domain-containing protein [Treponema succinifaciens]|uniref:ATP-binding cassette domain-containing protein n=1 Tax=Treponema TaxID=157 RepID=UPI0023F0DBCF|nr:MULTISPECIES: ATP-binding cassette domain-containing protein [Treponema]MDD6961569.1 ATP-binding cassette domain-containing protein [Treponema succinifaciens]MDY5118046.1 ATP-binding cassette domain-containing protein [Treponema succinifaciens]
MIEVENVSKLFGNFRAVDGISFSIQTGEIVGLLGPNGAGKTTTMRMISGFLEPDSGTVKIDGLDVLKNPVETKRKIGYMPESAPMYSDMIVADYLKYIAEIENQNPAEKCRELAEVCGLKEVMHKNIGELSRGNRQRVGLAHALMGNPEILILDEPTSGLDPNQVLEVRSLIKQIGKTHTVIISTHILSEVEMLCGRVIIISGGKKVADSPTEELREHFGNSSEVQVCVSGASTEEAEKIFRGINGVSKIHSSLNDGKIEFRISVEKNIEVRPELAKACVQNGLELFEMQQKKNSLEDVFRSLTSAHDSENGVYDKNEEK